MSLEPYQKIITTNSYKTTDGLLFESEEQALLTKEDRINHAQNI